MKMDASKIQRFFGPVEDAQAAAIAERMMDDKAFFESLKAFLAGEIEPREFAYETQIVAEYIDADLSQTEECAIAAFKDARERA